jgi:hypothetical protein
VLTSRWWLTGGYEPSHVPTQNKPISKHTAYQQKQRFLLLERKRRGQVCLPETKRLLQGSAAGRAAGGGSGAKAETENSRQNPLRAATAISMQSLVLYLGEGRVRHDGRRVGFTRLLLQQ